MNDNPADAELERRIPEICAVMSLCFIWTKYWLVIGERWANEGISTLGSGRKATFDNFRLNENEIITVACLQDTLVNIRKLADFFQGGIRKLPGGKRRNGEETLDVRAYQFPNYPKEVLFLEDTINLLHQRVVHLTLKTVRESESYWTMQFWQTAAGERSLKFLDYLSRDFKPQDKDVARQIDETREFVQEALEQTQRIK